MKFLISNEVEIHGLTREQSKICQKHLTIDNPKFSMAVGMGLSVWGVDRSLKYYQSTSDTLQIPVGALPDVVKLLQESSGTCTLLPEDFVDLRVAPSDDFFKTVSSKISLRDYQEEILKVLENHTIGVIQADTGSGKTVCFIELVARRKTTTVVLVHTKELALQTRENFSRFLQVPLEEIGFIGSGTVDIKPITVALHQTLNHFDDGDWRQIENYFGQVICDETHLVAANTFYSNMTRFKAKYKYGFTATPERSDGLREVVHFAAGPLIHKVGGATLDHALIRPEILVVDTGYDYFLPDTRDYVYMINDLCTDESRNRLILEEFKKHSDRPSVVLCGRVEQIEWFYKELAGEAVMLHGKMKKKERVAAMEKLVSGEVQHVVSSWELFSTGLDIARLEVLHLAAPKKALIKLKQAAGRVMRQSPSTGKKGSLVIDYRDKQSLLHSQSYQRLKILKTVTNGN